VKPVSGKKLLAVFFIICISLATMARMIAPDPNHRPSPTGEKHKPGYRKKVFQTLSGARDIAEKKINADPDNQNMIIRHVVREDGWVFYYEAQKFLMTGNPEFRNKDYGAILVRPDGKTEDLAITK
jgi:hypothetical protein